MDFMDEPLPACRNGKPIRRTARELSEASRLYDEGLSARAVGERLNLNHRIVLALLKRDYFGDLPVLKDGQFVDYRAPTRPRNKLNDDDVARLMSLRAQGVSWTKLAAIFGITRPHVGYIVKRERERARRC